MKTSFLRLVHGNGFTVCPWLSVLVSVGFRHGGCTHDSGSKDASLLRSQGLLPLDDYLLILELLLIEMILEFYSTCSVLGFRVFFKD